MWPSRGASEDGRDLDGGYVGRLRQPREHSPDSLLSPLRRQEVRPTAGSGEDPPPGSSPLCALGAGGASARVFLFLSGHESHCAPTLVTPRGLQMPTRGSGGLRHSVPHGGQRSLERGGGGDRGRSAQSTFGSGTRATCRGKRRAAGGEAWKGRRAPRAEGPL